MYMNTVFVKVLFEDMNSLRADGLDSLLCFTESNLKRAAGVKQECRHVEMK